ncbi:Cyclic nucleotide-gated potassium channel [Planctomycetes bacterium Pan216]|uniref:Cyclic nucleotide-gated potassium channel n=1 Tax=Kolteria novifilia TaxID=2527975 RepID=A0A518B473_9BACT|nr:Cyclic nucleotide-gated potassium channel [Planctomycetes bacterium Pan216]
MSLTVVHADMGAATIPFEQPPAPPCENDSRVRVGSRFEYVIQALIFVSLLGLGLETLPDIDPTTEFLCSVIEIVTVGFFTIEYAVRLMNAKNKLGFVFSFYGLIDLAAFLPFFITLGSFHMAPMRMFRILRILSGLKLLRYSSCLRYLLDAFRQVRDELLMFLVVTLLIIFVSSVAIYHLEHEAQPETFKSIFHCMWWAVATLTTVGYGDMYPITVAGKIFTGFVTILGVGTIAVPSGLIASALTKTKKERADGSSPESGNDGELMAA